MAAKVVDVSRETVDEKASRYLLEGRIRVELADEVRLQSMRASRTWLKNEIRRCQLARGDMLQVMAAAVALDSERKNGYLCRALETAIVVCYARPFSPRNAVGGTRHSMGTAAVVSDAARRTHASS